MGLDRTTQPVGITRPGGGVRRDADRGRSVEGRQPGCVERQLVRVAKGLVRVDKELTDVVWRWLVPYAEDFRERFIPVESFCRRYAFFQKRIRKLLSCARTAANNAVQFRAQHDVS